MQHPNTTPELVHQEVCSKMESKIYLNEKEMTAVINVFRVYEVNFRAGLMRAEVKMSDVEISRHSNILKYCSI